MKIEDSGVKNVTAITQAGTSPVSIVSRKSVRSFTRNLFIIIIKNTF